MVSYINKKGKEVFVSITEHAIVRFKNRWNRLLKEKQTDGLWMNQKEVKTKEEAVSEIERVFKGVVRKEEPSGHEKKRMEKHGKDTIFFRASNLRFVVQNSKIVTVEIAGENKFLN